MKRKIDQLKNLEKDIKKINILVMKKILVNK